MTFALNELSALRPAIVDLGRKASATILGIYEGAFAVRDKANSTPVTEADERSEALIVAGLKALTPEVPIVAEESQARGEGGFPDPAPSLFWLVDPLDGTREFVARNGQFAVNIGLVRDGRPVLGAILSPAEGIVWSGIVGIGAWRQVRDRSEMPIRARPKPDKGLVVVTSRSHSSGADSAVASAHRIAEHRKFGSAVKFGLIAEGSADFYPRMGATSEWDTCAGEALLVAAGGHVERTDGRLLEYGKPGFLNPDFVARGAW